MKTETIKEIGKRMGQQKGKSINYYNYKNGSSNGGLISKLLTKLTKLK